MQVMNLLIMDHWHILCKIYYIDRKLPQFSVKSSMHEVFYIDTFINMIPLEPKIYPTLNKYIETEMENYEIIYDRSYKNTLLINKKQSFSLCKLLNLKRFIYSHFYEPTIEIDLKPYYTLKDDNDQTLLFESRFESGNLDLVMKVLY